MSRHVPVLLKEVVEFLQLKPGMNVIDCTLGDAGHAEAILEHTAPNGKLLGIDADSESVLRAKQYLYPFQERVTFVRDNFVRLTDVVAEHNFGPVNGILFDLGWSTPQFSERGRGFSFDPPAGGVEPLDMRYGGKSEIPARNASHSDAGGRRTKSENELETAADILNNFSEDELAQMFRRYGEESLSTEIATAIVAGRKKAPIITTKQLVDIILQVYREKLQSTKDVPWIGGLHPATKVFQALRIAVNKELDVLAQVLPQAWEVLAPGGRLAVISFHSGEDRIVKHYFQKLAASGAQLVTKKPIVASSEEITNNPPSRSAKLRVVEKNN